MPPSDAHQPDWFSSFSPHTLVLTLARIHQPSTSPLCLPPFSKKLPKSVVFLAAFVSLQLSSNPLPKERKTPSWRRIKKGAPHLSEPTPPNRIVETPSSLSRQSKDDCPKKTQGTPPGTNPLRDSLEDLGKRALLAFTLHLPRKTPASRRKDKRTSESSTGQGSYWQEQRKEKTKKSHVSIFHALHTRLHDRVGSVAYVYLIDQVGVVHPAYRFAGPPSVEPGFC